jgi:hypothetical protein
MRGHLVTAALLLAGGASAQDPGYVRTHVPSADICLFWATRSFTSTPDAAGYSQANVFPAYAAAYNSWETVATGCSDYQFIQAAPIPNAQVGYDPNSGQNYNTQIFRELLCLNVVPSGAPCIAAGTCANDYKCWDGDDLTIALTTTTFSDSTGVIYDADTEFNAAQHSDGTPGFLFTVVDSPPCTGGALSESCVATDVQETLTHETGHAIGLDHELNNPNSTMAPTANIGETIKRTIDPGTALGFCTIYPAGQPSPPCDPTAVVTREISAVGHGTPGLQGMGCGTTGASLQMWGALGALVALLRAPRLGRFGA